MISKTELIMNIFLISVVFFIHFALSFEASSSVGCASPVKGLRSIPRAIYNVKRNTGIAQVREAIKKGANGVYNRLAFNEDGTPDVVGARGSAKDEFTDFITFLEGLIDGELRSKVVMVMFDLDLRYYSWFGTLWELEEQAKDRAAYYVVEGLANLMKKADKNFFVVLLVRQVSDVRIFDSNHLYLYLNDTMKALFERRLAFGVLNGIPSKNAIEFAEHKIQSKQVWEALDYDSPFSYLTDSVNLRNNGSISKVLINCELVNEGDDRKDKFLRERADGFITDKPAQVIEILEKKIGEFRLATLEDNPL